MRPTAAACLMKGQHRSQLPYILLCTCTLFSALLMRDTAAGSDGGEHAWINPGGGTFSNALNWDIAVPGPTDKALFDLTSAGDTVMFDSNVTNDRLIVRTDDVTFDLGSNTYDLANPATGVAIGESVSDVGSLTITNGTLSVAGTLDVGLEGGGSLLIQNGGAVSNFNGFIGHEPDADEIVTINNVAINGVGSTWINFNSLSVGFSGFGRLTIDGGASVSSGIATIASEIGSDGDVIVTGAGSSFSTSQTLYVGGDASGPGGSAILIAGTGANVSVGTTLKIWNTGHVVLTDGSIDAVLVDIDGGSLAGVGVVNGGVNNAGQVRLLSTSSLVGTMVVNGDYIQTGVGALFMDLGGTVPHIEFDVLDVNGQADLAGTLEVSFVFSFVPLAGQSFEIMTFNSRVGEFSTINGAGFVNNQTYLAPIYTNTNLTLASVIPGDGNLDFTVNAADYTVWADGVGLLNPDFTDGDYNGDGTIDGADYTIWANNFSQGVTAPSSAPAAVPEPSTFVLSALGLIGLVAYGWRRRRRA